MKWKTLPNTLNLPNRLKPVLIVELSQYLPLFSLASQRFSPYFRFLCGLFFLLITKSIEQYRTGAPQERYLVLTYHIHISIFY